MGQFATRIKFVLVLFAVITASTSAQLTRAVSSPLPSNDALYDAANLNVHHVPMISAENAPTVVATSPILERHRTPKVVALPQESPAGALAGYTWYDFQTNASMANRLTYFEDGSDKYVQFVWMASKDSTRDATTRIPGFNSARGSHYTFFDFNDPDDPIAGIGEWNKMEDVRSGWPALVQYSDGSAGTPSHTPVKYFRNAGAGDDQFFEFSTVSTPADSGLWPRAAVDGQDNTHLIYNRQVAGSGSQVVYRRSTDGGSTWEPEIFFTGPSGLLPQGQTGTLPNGAGGDTYAITARGPIVAVVYSDGPLRTLVRKSTDYGATWNDPTIASLRLLIDRNEMMIDSAVSIVNGVETMRVWSDSAVAPSAHHAIVIDGNNNIHVATGQYISYLIQSNPVSDPTARSGTIYSVNDDSQYQNLGIYYWQETDTVIYTVGLAGGGDWDGNGKIVSRRAYSGGSRYPSLGVDAANNVYLTYTSMKSGDVMPMRIDTTGTFDQGEPDTLIDVDGLFGHIWATHHNVGSAQFWSAPVDITPEKCNSLFASLCDNVVNDRMYIGYSVSAIPGDRVTNVETEATVANIYAMAFPLSGLAVISSVSEDDELDAQVAVYPNPANDVAHIQIQSVTTGPITVSVHTMQGETVSSTVSPAHSQEWTLGVPTNGLANGMYLIVIEQNGSKMTRTLNVLH